MRPGGIEWRPTGLNNLNIPAGVSNGKLPITRLLRHFVREDVTRPLGEDIDRSEWFDERFDLFAFTEILSV
jgi:hypothetical protein